MLSKNLSMWTLLCALTLTGCASSIKPVDTRPQLQASLRQPCDSPQPLTDGTKEATLMWMIQTAKALRVCKDRHAATVEAFE